MKMGLDPHDEIERLRERCEGYKGQVKAGAMEIERLRAALIAVANCDTKHDLTPYDYMHGSDEVRSVMKLVRETLGAYEQQASPTDGSQ